MTRSLTVGQGYTIEGEPAFYLGVVDGINRFQLKVDRKLHAFYFAAAGPVTVIDPEAVDMYADDQLPDPLVPTGKPVAIDEKAFLTFIYTATPELPNTAFCAAGRLEELCARQGSITGATSDLTLGKRYRGVNPSYCVVMGDQAYRQTGLREKYPELVLEMTPFAREQYLAAGAYADGQPVYVLAQSVEKFGGTHKEYDAWRTKVKGPFAEVFKGGQLATFSRRFVLTAAGKKYFAGLGLDEAKLRLLQPAK